MTEEASPEEISRARKAAFDASHPPSWVWDDVEAAWKAPINHPDDGYPYIWDEETLSWVSFPDYPRQESSILWVSSPSLDDSQANTEPDLQNDLSHTNDEPTPQQTPSAIDKVKNYFKNIW